MGRKKILILAGVILGFGLLGGAVFFWHRRGVQLVSPIGKLAEAPAAKLATWEDPAGFSFNYPKDIEIDPHREDTENYAHLELTAAGHAGRILVWVKATDYEAVEDWIEQEAGEDAQVFDSQLAGKPAKKAAWPEKLVTVAIDIDALVLVELYPDNEGFWQAVYDQVLQSFAFIPLESEEAAAPGAWQGSGGSGGIIVESEEIIE